MKILMFGTGVIGTIYGYVLAEAGHDVTHYVRPGKAQGLRDGIRMRLLDGRCEPSTETETLYRLKLTERLSPADDYDLLIVSVRHYQIESLLPLLRDGVGRADVLFFNNIWTGFDVVERYLPRDKFLWGFPVAGGGYREGVLDAALLGEVRLGEPDGSTTERLAQTAALFESAGIKPDIRADILHWQWVHFAINAGIVGAALKTGSAARFLDDVDCLQEGILAARDALEVCRARGVNLEAFEDVPLFYAPEQMAAQAVCASYQANLPARRIFERHTGLDELKRLYADVLQTADELQVEAPHFRALRPYVEACQGTEV